jgi:glyoxylase-like metal-dependent hydrolase (beta-lactamase superfamily II)
MSIKMLTREVGPWPMNTYLVVCEETNKSVIIDPGADPEIITDMAKDTNGTPRSCSGPRRGQKQYWRTCLLTRSRF